jgi:hypothetical protein
MAGGHMEVSKCSDKRAASLGGTHKFNWGSEVLPSRCMCLFGCGGGTGGHGRYESGADAIRVTFWWM